MRRVWLSPGSSSYGVAHSGQTLAFLTFEDSIVQSGLCTVRGKGGARVAETPEHYLQTGTSRAHCVRYCQAHDGCLAIQYTPGTRECRRFGFMPSEPAMTFVGATKLYVDPEIGDGQRGAVCHLKGTHTPSGTRTASLTATATPTPSPTATRSRTPTAQATPSPSASGSATPVPTATGTATPSAAPPLCSAAAPPPPAQSAVLVQLAPPDGALCVQPVAVAGAASALQSQSLGVRILRLDSGTVGLEVAAGCDGAGAACRWTYGPGSVGTEHRLPLRPGAAIELLWQYTPPPALQSAAARPKARPLATAMRFEAEVYVVTAPSGLFLVLLVAGTALLAVACALGGCCAGARGRSVAVVCQRATRRLHTAAALGLCLLLGGAVWVVVGVLCFDPPAGSLSALVFVGAGLAAVGLALLLWVVLWGMHDSAQGACAACGLPLGPWRFGTTRLQLGAGVRRYHRRCARCVSCGRRIRRSPWPESADHRLYHDECWEHCCWQVVLDPAYAARWAANKQVCDRTHR